MEIFSYDDYKVYVNDWVSSQPKGGYGEYKRLADFINVSSTMISQIFKGEKHLNLEMANEVCEFLNLDSRETEFFFLLVDYQRAGTYKLQQRLLQRIQAQRKHAQDLKNRMTSSTALTEEVKSVFYSSWLYAGVRNLCAVPGYSDASIISQHLGVPKNLIHKILEFLIENQLLKIENDRLLIGPARTHVPFESPHVNKHHLNWRMNGIQKMHLKRQEDFFSTFPMSLSHETAQVIREKLPAFLQEIDKLVIPSPSETVRCLNIDWFEY